MRELSPKAVFTLVVLVLLTALCPFAMSAESAQTETGSDRSLEESVGHVVLSTFKGAGYVAAGAFKALGKLAQHVYVEKQKQELADQFYSTFDQSYQDLGMNPDDYEAIRSRVTGVYMEEDESHAYGLDLLTFSDMPNVIIKENAALKLLSASEGDYKTFHLNGKLETIRHYKEGKLDGKMTTYYEDGSVKFIDFYEKGEIQLRRKFTPDGRLEFEQDYRVVSLYETKQPEMIQEKKIEQTIIGRTEFNQDLTQDEYLISSLPSSYQSRPRVA